MFERNLNLPHYFQVQKFCFALIGISLTSVDDNSMITNYFSAFVPITANILLCTSILFYAGLHFNDIDEVTDAMGPAWQISLSIIKWFTFMHKRREIREVLQAIFKWNLEASDEECAILAAENKNDVSFCRLFFAVVSAAGFIAVCKPFLIGLATWASAGHYPLVPPIKASYPLDMQNPLYFYLQLVWVCLGVFSAIYTTIGVDCLFSWITHNVIAQFGILNWNYCRIAKEHDGIVSTKSIIVYVKYHQRIIDIVQELNDVLGFIIFAKFSISCLQICVLAYQLSRIQNFADLVFLATFLLAVSLQLILYCRNGQRLKDESANISDYIFGAFEWQKLNAAKRKLLLMSMVRARRVCSLTGVFFVMDLSLYLWVIRTAASFITMLLSLDDKRVK